MPIIFIHGVDTRDGKAYEREKSMRRTYLQRIVIERLAKHNPALLGLHIAPDAYWGDLGAKARWNNISLPEVFNNSEPLDTYSDQLLDLAYNTSLISDRYENSATDETLGPSETGLRHLAQIDLEKFLSAAFAPTDVIPPSFKAEDAGIADASLGIAAESITHDEEVIDFVNTATSDDEVIAFIRQRILARSRELQQASRTYGTLENGDETLGVKDVDLVPFINESLKRLKQLPLRAASTVVAGVARKRLHIKLSQFIGDALVYMSGRGSHENPGLIVNRVISDIDSSCKEHPDEPLIVITHSLGSAIFYDLITYFDTERHVDAWVSVGAQLGQFEEMKLFSASDPNIGAGHVVRGVKPAVGYWLNVYDPIDFFSFRAAPIFADVDEDISYSTGSHAIGAHVDYFARESFYKMLADKLGGHFETGQ